jgi:4-amino-4-deoxy-L-arabinose transferase-like glycosyltransferase
VSAARTRRALIAVLAGRRTPLRTLLVPALLCTLLGLAVRLLYMADAGPAMYSADQPGTRMAARYTDAARELLAGDGVLYPRTWPNPSDTGLLSRPPGYPALLAATHAAVGPTYFDIQLVQVLLTSLIPPLLLLLTTRVLGRGPGTGAGLVAALSPPLGYSAVVVTPDSLSTLVVVLVVVLLWAARRGSIGCLLGAGALAGLATWLRPNLLLLGPFLAAIMPLSFRPARRALGRGLLLAGVALAAVAPITIRNLRLYHELVPVSINGGIVLWEGLADAGGERFGARRFDRQVAREEAERYGNPRYAEWWASPDGIWRDRERIRRSLAAIRQDPVWYATAVARRALEILGAEGTETPLVSSERAEPSADPGAATHWALRAASLLDSWRAPMRAVQRAVLTWGPGFAISGLATALLLAPRRALFLLAVPVYVLLVQAPVHFEPRFALPLYAFFPVFEGTACGLIVILAGRALRRRRASRASRA